MSEMIARVALAINAELTAFTIEEDREDCLKLARAAIEAMREPTEAMLDAAEDTNTGGGISDHGNAEPDLYEPETVWRTMIDAALSRGPQDTKND